MILALKFDYKTGYLDDVSVGGEGQTVVQDLETTMSSSAEIGMSLNPAKCELFVIGEDVETIAAVNSICDLLPGINIISADKLELLGSPLTHDAIPPIMEQNIEQVKLLSSRLPAQSAHVDLFLLKNCVSIPKLVYLLRCIPSWKFPELLSLFDAVLNDALAGCP